MSLIKVNKSESENSNDLEVSVLGIFYFFLF